MARGRRSWAIGSSGRAVEVSPQRVDGHADLRRLARPRRHEHVEAEGRRRPLRQDAHELAGGELGGELGGDLGLHVEREPEAHHRELPDREEDELTIKNLSRRRALGMLGAAAGAAVSAACGSGSSTRASSTTDTTASSGSGSSSACAVTPTETLGPYPSLTNFVRSDIREGKSGVPLALTITVVNANNSCGPVAGAAVDIWQCDAEGNYSEYSQPGYNGTGLTFLRGIQTTDGNGRVTFATIFPGWYAGRATHIHVEVKVDGSVVKVTQIAFPESVIAAVYASGAYASKGQNPTSNSGDMVFADSVSSEMAAVTGDTTSGYVATFVVGVSL
jgi:protocatechuate 3,4-dioxygenase beta subunit